MRLLQHKREAYWFYRVLSHVYDRWVNPLFWTPAMRTVALTPARLDERRLTVLDVGAGTGFTTEGIVAQVDPAGVTLLDQSPHQLARSERRPALDRCRRLLGDAERLPFATDSFDRYVSAGSIEYWPDPQRGITEAYRVVRPGGRALVIGPVRPANALVRRLADAWMLFPAETEYRAWFERAGFDAIEIVELAPSWYRSPRGAYAIAVAGRKPAPGPSALALPAPEPARAAPPLRVALRVAAGSLAGAAFVPLAAALALRTRIERRRGP